MDSLNSNYGLTPAPALNWRLPERTRRPEKLSDWRDRCFAETTPVASRASGRKPADDFRFKD